MSEASQPATANPVEYINHHLTNWCLGCDETQKPADVIDFSVIFVDTLLFGWLVGGLFMWIAWKVGKNLSLDKPSGLQNFLETLVEFVNQQVKDLFPGTNPLIGPLGLTIFVWVFSDEFDGHRAGGSVAMDSAINRPPRFWHGSPSCLPQGGFYSQS